MANILRFFNFKLFLFKYFRIRIGRCFFGRLEYNIIYDSIESSSNTLALVTQHDIGYLDNKISSLTFCYSHILTIYYEYKRKLCPKDKLCPKTERQRGFRITGYST